MRINSFLLTALLFILSNVSIAQTKEFRRYSLKSAIVEYELTGVLAGTAIMYFDDYGMKEATYENAFMDMYGSKQKTETVNYLTGYFQYNLDVTNNTATKTKNTVLKSLVEESKGNLEEVGREMFISMGGEMTGYENMIGKRCEIWELKSMGTKIWVWENIPLRSETNLMGIQIIRVATRINENAEIPVEKLEIPTDIEFTEINMNNFDEIKEKFQKK